MEEKIHWFTGKEDCEKFFKRLAENEGELFSENLCIEGNSGTTYDWIITASNLVGYEKIGIDEDVYAWQCIHNAWDLIESEGKEVNLPNKELNHILKKYYEVFVSPKVNK